MVAVHIIFTIDEDLHGVNLNCMHVNKTKEITAEDLRAISMAAQIQFMKNLNDEKAAVRDAVFMNMMYLGYMSQEEFHKKPPLPTAEQIKETMAAAQKEAVN